MEEQYSAKDTSSAKARNAETDKQAQITTSRNSNPGSGLLLVWLLTIPAVAPLIQPNTITDSADSLLHLYRVVALSHAISQGALLPRWLPDLAYGYGLPLFVFYAPLSYYVTLALDLSGLGAVNALNGSFILALLLSGTGVYLFTRDRFGSKAGILAGVAYVYAPIQLLNTLFRGSLPAVWAMAAFPFVFWIFGRLIRQSIVSPRTISPLLPLSALVFGAALLLHNISSLLFVPFLGLYLGIELLIQFMRASQRATFLRQVVLPVGLAGALGLGLATFFLLPAIIEKDFGQVERAIISPDFDFRFNFVSLQGLLALPEAANTGRLNPHYPVIVGLAQLVLATLGLLGIRCLREPHQWAAAIFAIIGLAGTIFLMLSISISVWERLPLITFAQHPHRLLGPSAFMVAILSGLAVVAFPERFRLGITATGIILIFITTLPLLYPRYHDPFPTEPTILDMMTYEHTSGAIGTTSFGEYLPLWVKHVPAESPLEPMYQAGSSIERLDPAYLPDGANIEFASYGFNQAELIIDSPEPYQAIFHTFYFPGWQARLDGKPSLTTPVTERGLIGLVIPEGRHHLQLSFYETPLRRTANTISIVSLVVVLVLFLGSLKDFSLDAEIRHNDLTTRQFVALAGLAIVLIGAKIFYVDRFDTPFKHTFDGTTVTGVDVPRQVNFGNQVNLLAYDLDHRTAAAGQNFDLTAYWQARQPLNTNYSSLAQLIDAENHLYAAQDNLHPGGFPSTGWQPWGFVQDSHIVPVPHGTPPGDYFLVTGLYDPSTWARLPIISDGDPGWVDIIAIPVRIEKSERPPSLTELGITWPVVTQTSKMLETSEALSIQLLGATPARKVILPNDFLRVALFWEAITRPNLDYQITLRLQNEAGEVILTETTEPSHNRYPTTWWAAGERVRDNHALWIPPDFPPGTYRLQVRVLDEASQAVSAWIPLGQMNTAE